MIKDNYDFTKHVIDGLSFLTAIGTLVQVLPAIAALFTIIWTGIRIYESNTAQDMIAKWKKNRAQQ